MLKGKGGKMLFAKRVFTVAGIYGILVLAPMYFMEARISAQQPPAITHPDLYYGFIGCALVFQLVYFLIARDPVRYRPLMVVGMLEKVVYTLPVILLYLQGRVYPSTLYMSLVDPVFGLLFFAAYRKTPAESI